MGGRWAIYLRLEHCAFAITHCHPAIPIEANDMQLWMQAVYTIGQRLVFFFPILAMWFLGPTAMLVTSVVVTSAVWILDQWNPQNPTAHIHSVLEYRQAQTHVSF